MLLIIISFNRSSTVCLIKKTYYSYLCFYHYFIRTYTIILKTEGKCKCQYTYIICLYIKLWCKNTWSKKNVDNNNFCLQETFIGRIIISNTIFSLTVYINCIPKFIRELFIILWWNRLITIYFCNTYTSGLIYGFVFSYDEKMIINFALNMIIFAGIKKNELYVILLWLNDRLALYSSYHAQLHKIYHHLTRYRDVYYL